MTHRMITSKFLRKAYAEELWQSRRWLKGDWGNAVRFGMESTFWKMQRVLQ